VVGIITHGLLEISFSLQQCKNFWNRLRFDKVNRQSSGPQFFFGTQCISRISTHCMHRAILLPLLSVCLRQITTGFASFSLSRSPEIPKLGRAWIRPTQAAVVSKRMYLSSHHSSFWAPIPSSKFQWEPLSGGGNSRSQKGFAIFDRNHRLSRNGKT